MGYHLLRSFTLAMHVPPHDKTLENHITFLKESENTTLSTCKHCCLNRECAEYRIYYYQGIETSHRPRFKSKLSRTRQKKTGKQTYTDYVVLAIWAIGGQNFGHPVVKMVANATGRVLILLPGHSKEMKMFWKCVLAEWIRMVIALLVLEWFAGINCICLLLKMAVLPLG